MTTVSSYMANNCSSINSFTNFLSCANSSGGNWLFTAIDVMVFAILLISMAGIYGWEIGALSAGFIGIVLTILFAYMGVINWTVTGMFVGGLIALIMYVIWSSNKS